MTNKQRTGNRTANKALAGARALLTETQLKLDELEAQAKLDHVLGTRELKDHRPSLDEQVATMMTAKAQTIASVAASLGVPVGRVLPAFKSLRDGLKIHNIGSEVEPRWQHVLAVDCPTPDLRALVLRLICDRPFTHRELVVVTGVGENRISGVIAKLRADDSVRIVNLGNNAKARWFVLPPDSVTIKR